MDNSLYLNCKIYGPYFRKDGRRHVCIVYPNGYKTSISYPKFILEQKLGRRLSDNETVHHIDGNFLNDSEENLQILPRVVHVKLDTRRLNKKEFYCPECNKCFTLVGKKLCEAIANRKRGKAGPFCSRSCVNTYSTKIKNGFPKLEVIQIIPEYIINRNLIQDI
jgi:hypothetical protein